MFPGVIEHKDVANMVKSIFPGCEITGAGFFMVDGKEVWTAGKSQSLGLDPGEHDAMFIRNALNLNDTF